MSSPAPRYRISLKHNFETAHRLSHPDAPHKCQSIHGHSWWVEVFIEGAQVDEMGMLVEFGAFKKVWRGFLDAHVDHHLVVHQDDPIAPAILSVLPDSRLLRLPFDPTTENLARWLWEQATSQLRALRPDDTSLHISRIHLQETRVNAAEFCVAPAHTPSH